MRLIPLQFHVRSIDDSDKLRYSKKFQARANVVKIGGLVNFYSKELEEIWHATFGNGFSLSLKPNYGEQRWAPQSPCSSGWISPNAALAAE